MEVYIDDMLVKSTSAVLHIAHLSEAFQILRKYNMKLNPSKCAHGASVAQFEELNCSPQAMQPKGQFSSGSIAHKASVPKSPSSSVCRALQLRKASAPKSPSSSVCRALQLRKASAPTEPQ